MSGKKLKLESAKADIQTVQVWCQYQALDWQLITFVCFLTCKHLIQYHFSDYCFGLVNFQRKFSKDDGGEEVELMPEIELSSDSEVEVICIDPQPTFHFSLAQMISG